MQKKKYPRVNFRINHCSSEDPQYPVTQLLLQSPQAKGWQSKRFSTYPQIIIIQLVQPTLLRQISFLSHQSKIATKIQIESKLDESKDWKKLGYVSLSSNESTNFHARQLRSANLNAVPAYFIKLILKANHTNAQNIFNQVGLISFSVYGEKMVQSHFNTSLPQGNSLMNIQSHGSNNNTLQFDKQTLQKLKQLEIRKKQAVQNQEFDKAKNIKQQIQRIKNIGQTLMLLQQKKQQAIKKQDYQAAKIINDQMKKMRDQNNWGPNISNKPSGNPAQFYKKQKTQQQYEEQEEQRQRQNEKYNNNKTSVSPISNQNPKTQNLNTKAPQNNTKPQQKGVNEDQRPLNVGNKNNNKPFDQDQRPLNNKGGNVPNQYPQQENQGYEQQANTGGQLQPLGKQLYGEVQSFFNVIDQEIFRHIYSKDHKNRQNGMMMLKQKLSQRIMDKQTFIQAILFCIKATIDDRIASVLISTLQTFEQFMKKIKPLANSNTLPYAQYILQRLSDYLGHANQKVVNISQSIYSNLPIYQLTNKDTCYKCLSMTYKREKPPKILTGKLKMISKIVAEYQLGKNYEDTIGYVVKYVDDKNNDVRSAAINALCVIAGQIGYNSVQPFLKNVRPQIIKTIQQQMENVEGGGGNNQKDYDQKPIKAGNKAKGKQAPKQFQSVQNQFIEMPNKNKKTNKQQQQIVQQQQQEDNSNQCPFCKKIDQRFSEEDYLDMHFFHSCPMLTICLQCKQTIQVSNLTSHLVGGQCQNSKYFKRCPRCKEAVHQKIYKTHVEKKQCLSAKPLATANRCPLCHLDIQAGVDGWKEHLVEEGCENNPRK